jgi:hypothetical protein
MRRTSGDNVNEIIKAVAEYGMASFQSVINLNDHVIFVIPSYFFMVAWTRVAIIVDLSSAMMFVHF